jgi:hypothetical protein
MTCLGASEQSLVHPVHIGYHPFIYRSAAMTCVITEWPWLVSYLLAVTSCRNF